MNIYPQEIRIGQTRWVIKFSEIEEFGRTDPNTATIYLRSDQSCDLIRDTLLHEVLHAICFSYGVPTMGAEVEEAILKTLTPVLLDVLSKNPMLTSLLFTERN